MLNIWIKILIVLNKTKKKSKKNKKSIRPKEVLKLAMNQKQAKNLMNRIKR